MDSTSVESESDMTTEEEDHEAIGTEPSLQKCAPSQRCYAERSSGQVTQSPTSPSASEDDDEQSMPHQRTWQQPATSWWALLLPSKYSGAHTQSEPLRKGQ